MVMIMMLLLLLLLMMMMMLCNVGSVFGREQKNDGWFDLPVFAMIAQDPDDDDDDDGDIDDDDDDDDYHDDNGVDEKNKDGNCLNFYEPFRKKYSDRVTYLLTSYYFHPHMLLLPLLIFYAEREGSL